MLHPCMFLLRTYIYRMSGPALDLACAKRLQRDGISDKWVKVGQRFRAALGEASAEGPASVLEVTKDALTAEGAKYLHGVIDVEFEHHDRPVDGIPDLTVDTFKVYNYVFDALAAGNFEAHAFSGPGVKGRLEASLRGDPPSIFRRLKDRFLRRLKDRGETSSVILEALCAWNLAYQCFVYRTDATVYVQADFGAESVYDLFVEMHRQLEFGYFKDGMVPAPKAAPTGAEDLMVSFICHGRACHRPGGLTSTMQLPENVRVLELYGWPGLVSIAMDTTLCDDFLNAVKMQASTSHGDMIPSEIRNTQVPLYAERVSVVEVTGRMTYFDRVVHLHASEFASEECKLVACNGTKEDAIKVAAYEAELKENNAHGFSGNVFADKRIFKDVRMSEIVTRIAEIFKDDALHRRLHIRILTCNEGFAAPRSLDRSEASRQEDHDVYHDVHGAQTSIAYAHRMCNLIVEFLWAAYISKQDPSTLKPTADMDTDMFRHRQQIFTEVVLPSGEDAAEQYEAYKKRDAKYARLRCYDEVVDSNVLYARYGRWSNIVGPVLYPVEAADLCQLYEQMQPGRNLVRVDVRAAVDTLFNDVWTLAYICVSQGRDAGEIADNIEKYVAAHNYPAYDRGNRSEIRDKVYDIVESVFRKMVLYLSEFDYELNQGYERAFGKNNSRAGRGGGAGPGRCGSLWAAGAAVAVATLLSVLSV